MAKFQPKAFLAKSLFCLSVICLSWSEPLTISSDNSYDPHIDSNDNGLAIITWTTSNEKDYEVQSVFYNGASWEDIEIISSGFMNLNPNCKIDKNGNCVAIWESIEENSRYVYGSNKPYNSSWQPSELISTEQAVTESHLAANDNGLFAIAWINEKDSSIQISYSQFDEPWSEPRTVATTENKKYHLKLKVDNNNHALITWINSDSGVIYECQSLTTIDEKWSDPILLSDDTPVTGSSLSIDQTGNGYCSWIDSINGLINVKEYLDSRWAVNPTIIDVKPFSSKVSSKNENSYLAWVDGSSGNLQCSKNSMGVWQKQQDIANNVISADPLLTIDGLGRAVLGWNGENNNEYLVNYYDGSDIIGEPTQITQGGVNQELKFSASDNVTFAVWTKIDDKGEAIQVAMDIPK